MYNGRVYQVDDFSPEAAIIYTFRVMNYGSNGSWYQFM